MIKPILTVEEYALERAICDKAAAYAEAVMSEGTGKRKRNYITAAEAALPEYSACTNDMRGRVEQFEILRDLPENLGAYIGYRDSNDSEGLPLTVWTGLQIGTCTIVERKFRGRWRFDPSFNCYATIGGREYYGVTAGVGCYVGLRETAASKRKRKA